MSNLTPAILSELDSALRRQRGAILNQIRTRLHGSDDPGQLALANHLDESGDAADADLLNDTDIALLDHELTALGDIDAALARLQSGQTGDCAACGEPVPAARLLANPAARTCIACQENIEKQHGGTPHSI